ncbi:ABC transporter ATP-binding protein [Natribaculum luteum]|uniref:ABC transporter ATP-binding protein n=1 Tax=Natribaculum luteum TaxID=1586232 RepID=A0ABD5P0E3_9EURY|nr:ABC transporter ATP-binding protein [Natribaculum luteum]
MSSATDSPLLALDSVEVHFTDETALMEAIPERIKERFGWNEQPVRAVDDVSLDIEDGDVLAIIGESGSGKTTLGKTAIGLEEPTSGSVKYRGYDVQELEDRRRIDDVDYRDVRKNLQIIHQDSDASLNPYRTVMTSLKEPLRRYNPELTHADCRRRILEIFNVVGLTPANEYADRYPHELSGGEKQRVSMVRAMLVEPDLVLADEPVAAQDPSLRIKLMDLMLELQDLFDTAYIFVSHNLEHARYMTSNGGRIAVMYLGEIVEIGPAKEVLANPKHPYTKILKWASLDIHPDVARRKLEMEVPLRESSTKDDAATASGCRFHPRCPKAREICSEQSPFGLVSDSNGADHEAACFRGDSDHEYWRSDPLDPDGEIEISE